MASQVLLKLKQASGVLGVSAKELQNLVQFGVVRPRKRADVFWFDGHLLLQAKIALHVKASLRTSTDYLARMTKELSRLDLLAKDVEVLRVQSRAALGQPPVDVIIPLRELKEELQLGLPLAEVHRDLPRGRKSALWKRQFLSTVQSIGNQIGDISEQEIAAQVRLFRSEKRKKRPLEITVVPERKKKTA